MLEYSSDVHIQRMHDELREMAIARPRLDRPELREAGRFRGLVHSLVRPPVRAALQPGERVPQVTIRTTGADDQVALTRLAEISERRLPHGHILVAEIGLEVVAALPVEGGPLLSDLRRPTRDVIQLLELRAGQIRTAERSPRAA